MILQGWLSVDPVYSEDFYTGDGKVEIYTDGPDLGNSIDVIEEINAYHGQCVRITIEVMPT